MKDLFFRILTICFLSLMLSVCVSAQNLGNIGGNIDSGNTGSGGNFGNSGNTGSNNNSSSSGGYSSSGSSSNSSSANSDFGTTIEAPIVPESPDSTSQTFIGRDSSVPFIGREKPFSDQQTNNGRKPASTLSSTRRATSSRTMTSNRSMLGRSGINSSSGGRTVRATTQTEFSLSPMEVNHQATEFQTRISRLPSLHVIPEQIGVNLESTPQGNVATLTGTVNSERERKVMKQLLLFEPGIDKVDNKLIINGN
jgi:hypothetical protein